MLRMDARTARKAAATNSGGASFRPWNARTMS